ncbi:SRPBCC family protein [Streptomyces sp. CSDS2]|uniref:SRPBCC family protein n=1 Tax=Streptomyces sp. CSDS2 TaxID=3055051 RepID=UPI0025B215BA|nr:SRPBCC family protein [Streptomyces sp. CSDS2]MDN3262846.1 SRPBCC family protein [Streptomyces sp. CSDS2]
MVGTRVHEVEVAARAGEVFGLLAELANWPWMFRPFVHAEVLGEAGGFERCGMWTTSGERVEAWVALRRVDAARMRIDFEPERPAPPLTRMERAWTVEPVGEEECLVRLEHRYEAAGGDAALEETGAVIDTIAQAETAAVKAAAELPADRRILVVDEVRVAGSADTVHRVLYDVAAWPGLLAHVERAEVLQDEDGAQLVEVDTREADGGILAMRTARVGRGGTLVAYKQLVLPPIGSSHTVRWRVEPDGDGVTVRSEQVVVLAPDVADVAAVTAFVRRELSAKVRLVLDRAKEIAEAPAPRR